MKKLLFVIFMAFSIICQAQTSQFEKPRYLKHATLMCPIDMTKSYSSEDIIVGNKFSITISPAKKYQDVIEDSAGKKIVSSKELMDTVLVKTILIEKGWAFDVVQQIGSFSIIKFWNLNTPFYKKQPIKQNNTLNKDFEITKVEGLIATIKNIEYDLSRGFYIVPTKTIQNNSTEFENKKNLWSMGLLVLPIKLRPFATESGQFEFSNGVSIGTVFSWTVRHSWTQNYTSNFLLYTGISSYKADSSKIKVPREDYTIVAFSPAAGWMWEKNNVQLSVLVGVDFPAGSLQKKWVYRNQPWFGIGIGIGLFKINNDTKTGNEAN